MMTDQFELVLLSDGFLRLAGAVGRQRALHTQNSGFAAVALRRHISTFRGYRILFSIRNPYIDHFTNHFSIHSWPSYPQKVVLHSITARFCLRPSFRHVDFHFRTYKRDLAILIEWWQQRIAWWELLNAACQIIFIRKQQQRYKAYSAGQIRAEGNNYPRASKRACVTSPLFGQGKTIFCFLIVICNSLLLLKSLPINVNNCIKFYVNCSASTGTYDWQ